VSRARVPLNVAFGLAVRQLREQQSLSQEELGLRTGLHRSHVGEIERAELNPTLKSVELIAEALGVTPSELIASAEGLRRLAAS
jgi:XRE family transcriptional regulator, regulator of sulfur utilization